MHAALAGRLWLDELYAATVGRAFAALARVAAFFDRWVWGGAVEAAGRTAETVGQVNRAVDEDGLNAGFDHTSEHLRGSGRRYAKAQTGDAQSYLRVVAIGLAVVGMLLLWGGVR